MKKLFAIITLSSLLFAQTPAQAGWFTNNAITNFMCNKYVLGLAAATAATMGLYAMFKMAKKNHTKEDISIFPTVKSQIEGGLEMLSYSNVTIIDEARNAEINLSYQHTLDKPYNVTIKNLSNSIAMSYWYKDKPTAQQILGLKDGLDLNDEEVS